METEILQTFLSESVELLQEMEDSLLSLENSPNDQDRINSLFRSVHTIKGSSGIVGIESVEKFTHGIENLLSQARDGAIPITGGIIELMLECRDHISSLLEFASAGEAELPAGVAQRDRALTAKVNSLLNGAAAGNEPKEKAQTPKAAGPRPEGDKAETDAWHISLRFGRDVLRNGMDPISFLNYLGKLGEITSLSTLCDAMPAQAEMDPESCYLGFEIDLRSDLDKKAISDVFEFVKDDCAIHILPPHSRIDDYVELIRGLPESDTMLGEILVRGKALTQSELEQALKLQKAGADEDHRGKALIGEIMVNAGMVYPEMVDAALEKQKKNLVAKAREALTIRIDAAKLDVLVNLVGELVISSANMEQHSQRIKDGALMESSSGMLRLVEEIRDSAMKIRMVPIGDTFSRFNRVVRDISRDFGKEIELAVSGGDTELDKTVVEKINDPLMHLVRNAADHGIEKPEARVEAGKPPKGIVRLNAYHDAGSIVIEVSDDGRGLNRGRITEKALNAGLISQGQTLSDRELFGLIFEPGFSTAEEVTKLSGRGVGMDVVKRNIEGLRGTVEVESEDGRGATVRIRLPLTLAIIDGFMVDVDNSFYVIPLDMVVECVELSEADREAANRRSYMNLRGEVLPYIRLREYFSAEGAAASHENVVIVQYAGQKTGLVVDELYGEVQTVIKSLGKVYRDVKGISGATIMGNGRVALIIDVPRLVQTVDAA
ncbi:MAG: chemotaxis protein CheA [Deltaproteobacteria bacterium]|nr:chemotaxis protein CheA [Deltaproteobacteria bacterium]